MNNRKYKTKKHKYKKNKSKKNKSKKSKYQNMRNHKGHIIGGSPRLYSFFQRRRSPKPPSVSNVYTGMLDEAINLDLLHAARQKDDALLHAARQKDEISKERDARIKTLEEQMQALANEGNKEAQYYMDQRKARKAAEAENLAQDQGSAVASLGRPSYEELTKKFIKARNTK
jgi:hypothetical protein